MMKRAKPWSAMLAGIGRTVSALITGAILVAVPMASRSVPPPVTGGLFAHLQADAGLQLSGSEVFTWEDQATGLGGANDATNAGGSGTGPMFLPNGINGLPTLSFNGSSQFLQIGGNAAFDTDTFTWIIVTQYTPNPASTQILLNSGYATGAGTSNNRLWGTLTGKGDPIAYASSASSGSRSTAGTALNAPMILSAVWADNDTISQWVNGKRSPGGGGADAVPSGHLYTLIGKTADETTRFFNGNISEILIYDRALSGAARQQVEAFLGDKYTIAIVPEPSVVALLALASATMMAARRRRRSPYISVPVIR